MMRAAGGAVEKPATNNESANSRAVFGDGSIGYLVSCRRDLDHSGFWQRAL
jgi:hypothetical protein